MFRQGFSCPALLVLRLVPLECLQIQGYHLLWLSFPTHFSNNSSYLVQAAARSLATTCAISVDVFSSGYLDVSVLRVRFSYPMYSGMDTSKEVGFPIRMSADNNACLPALRSFSQATTSFIACYRQGIHHMLLVT
ncbi:MAG: hypothetical protein MESAZ_01221 [Saezia sanguinis]